MKLYQSEIISRFSFHKPTPEGIEKMKAIRKKVRELACLINDYGWAAKERDLALAELSSVMMYANSSIVQEFPVDVEDV